MEPKFYINRFTLNLFKMGFLIIMILFSEIIYAQDNVEIVRLKDDAINHPFYMENDIQEIQICGLQIGKKYSSVVFQTVRVDLMNFKLLKDGNLVSSFVATEKCQRFFIHREPIFRDFDREVTVVIYCTDCESTLRTEVKYKPDTDPGNNVKHLVKDVLLANSCFKVIESSIEARGSVGTFTGGGTSLGMKNGIYLFNSPEYELGGPNTVTGAGNDMIPSLVDPDLGYLNNNRYQDIAAIEFDFIPSGTSMEFKYIFASEEYCDYIDHIFVDAFGFFLSGPGINGPFKRNAINIATLPTTGQSVSIKNVNHLRNSEFYRDNNTDRTNQEDCAGIVINPIASADIQFDGFTTILTAKFDQLQECETYHIKMVLGDGADKIFGSGVFLQGNSFTAGGGIDIDVVFDQTGSNFLYENCGSNHGVVKFVRNDIDPDNAEPINIGLNVSGTATKGRDYNFSSNQTITVPVIGLHFEEINVIPDTIFEGIEDVQLELDVPCTCEIPFYEFFIVDVDTLIIEPLEDRAMCAPTPWTLNPTVTGGVPDAAIRAIAYGIKDVPPSDYTFEWTGPNGYSANTKRIDFTPPSDPGAYEYFFMVSDDCGNVAFDTVVIKVIGTPLAKISGNGLICDEVSTAELPIELGGVGPWNLVYSYDGVPQAPIVVNDSPYMLPAGDAGTYELISVESNNCPGEVEGIGVVDPVLLLPLASAEETSCFNGDDGTATAMISGGTAPYTYEWSSSSTDATATGLSPGTVTVTITDSIGCKTTASTMISQPTELQAAAVEIQGTTCIDPNIGTADLTTSGGTAPYSFAWSNGGGNLEDPNTLTAGDYVITVTDDNNCTTEANVTISADENTPVAIALAPFKITCKENIVAINGNGSSLGSNFTYSWTASDGGVIEVGNASLEPTVSQIGTYQLIVTNTDNGCTNTAIVSVEDDKIEPEMEIDMPEILTCEDDQVDLAGRATSSGNFDYEWLNDGANISNTNTASASDVGTYTLLVTNKDNGCTTEESIVVNEDRDLPTVMANSPDLLTCKIDEVQINGNGSDTDNVGGFEYVWTASNGGAITQNGNTLTPSVSSTGTYTLEVTNLETGCSDTKSTVVDEDMELPTIVFEAAKTLTCQDEEVDIDASQSSFGTFTYEWSTIDGNILSGENTLLPSVNEKGTYHLLITNTENGCTSEDDILVDQMADFPVVELADVEELNCDVKEIIIDGTNSVNAGSFSTTWSTVDGNIVSEDVPLTATVNQPGTYELLIENLDTGCKKRKTIKVTQDIVEPEIIAGDKNTLSCAIDDLKLDATIISSSSDYSLEWATVGGNIVNGNTSLNPVIDQPGTYSIIITNNDNHCTAESSVEIEKDENAPNAIIVDPEMLTCIVKQIQLSGIGSTEGTDISYEWSTTDGHIVNGVSDIDPYVNQTGSYTITVKDASNGCETSYSIDVNENIEDPTADAGDDGEITCKDPETTLSGNDSGPNATYKWTTKYGNIVSGELTLYPIVDQVGEYELVVTNDENGCTETDISEITSNEVYPDVNITDPVVLTCEIKECPLTSSVSNGNDLSFDWSTSNGNIKDGETTNEININEPGEYELVVVDGDTGCKTTQSVIVIQDIEEPIVDAGSTGEITCTVVEIPLQGSGSEGSKFKYEWTTSNGDISTGANSLNAVAVSAGVYELLITNSENGCSSMDNIEITVSDEVPTELRLDPIAPLCFGDKGSVGILSVEGGVPPFEYSMDGEDFSTEPGFENLEPGDYIVYLLDSNGCKLQANLNIPFVPKVTVSLQDTVEISLGADFELQTITNIAPEDIEQIVWSPEEGLSCTDCLNPTTVSEFNTVYTVTVINKNGCSETASIALRVDREVKIYFPTGISPLNGDGVNDSFYPIVEKGVKTIQTLQVFDRWGTNVFVNSNFLPNDPKEGWSGLDVTGKSYNSGVFGWYAVVELFDGSTKIYKGDITLLN